MEQRKAAQLRCRIIAGKSDFLPPLGMILCYSGISSGIVLFTLLEINTNLRQNKSFIKH
jgi:hypothetical protein